MSGIVWKSGLGQGFFDGQLPVYIVRLQPPAVATELGGIASTFRSAPAAVNATRKRTLGTALTRSSAVPEYCCHGVNVPNGSTSRMVNPHAFSELQARAISAMQRPASDGLP